MPRLSIIVPYLGDDSEFEKTVLSILENRPNDFELLVAHSGNYSDPYGLGNDEIVVIESPDRSSTAEQLNLATGAACSPHIQVLLPGAVVMSNWADESLKMLASPAVDAVCVPIADSSSKQSYLGIDREALPHRRIATHASKCAGPLLCGGVIRRKRLLQLNGWYSHASAEISEVEFALLSVAMELNISVATSATIIASRQVACGREPSYEMGYGCGALACAYSSVEGSGFEIDSLVRRLGHLASGLMNPKTVAERLGWVMGIRDRSFVQSITARLEHAAETLEPSAITLPMNGASDSNATVQRRAA